MVPPVRGECFFNAMKKMYRTIFINTLRYYFLRYTPEITQGERRGDN